MVYLVEEGTAQMQTNKLLLNKTKYFYRRSDPRTPSQYREAINYCTAELLQVKLTICQDLG